MTAVMVVALILVPVMSPVCSVSPMRCRSLFRTDGLMFKLKASPTPPAGFPSPRV